MEPRHVLSHSALTPIHVGLHRLQKRISIVIGILGDWAAFIGAVGIALVGALLAALLLRVPKVNVTAAAGTEIDDREPIAA